MPPQGERNGEQGARGARHELRVEHVVPRVRRGEEQPQHGKPEKPRGKERREEQAHEAVLAAGPSVLHA